MALPGGSVAVDCSGIPSPLLIVFRGRPAAATRAALVLSDVRRRDSLLPFHPFLLGGGIASIRYMTYREKEFM